MAEMHFLKGLWILHTLQHSRDKLIRDKFITHFLQNAKPLGGQHLCQCCKALYLRHIEQFLALCRHLVSIG